MSRFPEHVFRRYDIRGKAGEEISTDLAYAVGRGLGSCVRAAGGTRTAVGRDVRPSSPELAAAVASGFAASGMEVLDLGIVPTPVLYHALYRRELGGGIVVTGSHNPRGDNGLKSCLGTAPFWGEDIVLLRAAIERQDYASGDGSVASLDYVPDFLDELTGRFAFSRPFKVAVDAGNGVMGPVVLEACERLGIEVVPLFCEPDGTFPNHLPDPEVPAYMEELGRTVVEHGADLGLGFDGDGDRVGVFDETGRKIAADWLIALFARDLLPQNPGGIVRFDVKCSSFLAEDVRAHGGEPWMGETGHSILKRDVVARDALLGGELSGHIVFNRGYLPIDDSLFCALQCLRIVDEAGVPLSALFRDFPDLVSTAEIKVACPDDKKFAVVDALAARFQADFDVITVDGARVNLDDGTWFLVRASNTTPNLTLRFEGRTRGAVDRAQSLLYAALAEHPDVGR